MTKCDTCARPATLHLSTMERFILHFCEPCFKAITARKKRESESRKKPNGKATTALR